MSQDAFQKARERIAFHEREIRRLKEWIATGEALLGERETAAPNAYSVSAETGTFRVVPGSPGISSPTAVVLSEAEAVLRDAGKSMTAAEIYETLIRRGVKISGKSPKGNMTAKFSTRREVFTFEGKETGLWSLTEWHRKEKTPSGRPESALQIHTGQGRHPGTGEEG